ncbi:hypothetical protein [Paenibacillus elgii]|uniref:hypothetical protein n=1 Tax=Paenibacillus elgii TaxID=189691 RepID=UPI000248CAB1|nr:hypothetical protein [Paenibacillus elgii]
MEMDWTNVYNMIDPKHIVVVVACWGLGYILKQTEMLRVCGYATDPDYTRKLNNLIASYSLEKYDKEATELMLNAGGANTVIET